MFHYIFSSLARSRYLSLFSLLFSFILWSAGTPKFIIQQVLLFYFILFILISFSFFFFFFFTITRSGGLVVWPTLGDPFVSRNHRKIAASHFLGRIHDCAYTILFVWSNFIFLRISQRITFPIQTCLVLYSFTANLLYSLIMWVIVSFLWPHNLHLLFCYVLPIFALT